MRTYFKSRFTSLAACLATACLLVSINSLNAAEVDRCSVSPCDKYLGKKNATLEHITALRGRIAELTVVTLEKHLNRVKNPKIYKNISDLRRFLKHFDKISQVSTATWKISKLVSALDTLQTAKDAFTKTENLTAAQTKKLDEDYSAALTGVYTGALAINETDDDNRAVYYEEVKDALQTQRRTICTQTIKNAIKSAKGISERQNIEVPDTASVLPPCDKVKEHDKVEVNGLLKLEAFKSTPLGKLVVELSTKAGDTIICDKYVRVSDVGNLVHQATVFEHLRCERIRLNKLLESDPNNCKTCTKTPKKPGPQGRDGIVRIVKATYKKNKRSNCDATSYLKSKCEDLHFNVTYCIKSDDTLVIGSTACAKVQNKKSETIKPVLEKRSLKVCRFRVNSREICPDLDPGGRLSIKFSCKKGDTRDIKPPIKDERWISLDCRAPG